MVYEICVGCGCVERLLGRVRRERKDWLRVGSMGVYQGPRGRGYVVYTCMTRFVPCDKDELRGVIQFLCYFKTHSHSYVKIVKRETYPAFLEDFSQLRY